MPEKIKLSVQTTSQVAVVSFELKDSIEPSGLQDFVADLPAIPGDRIVIISGRGPIWLFGVIIHHYHYCQAIATHDPRLDGAVVIESHIRGVNIGDIVHLPAKASGSVS